jgi:micrococcal nuclease
VRRSRSALAAGLSAAVLAGCGGLGSDDAGSDGPTPPVPPAPADAFSAVVERVVDGDTFVAVRAGDRIRVRLIGIDAPESVQPDAPVDCYGPESAAALGQLLPPGTVVRGAYEAGQPLDQFGRELWDVWLADGRFVQAELVRNGAADARLYPPHDEYAELLASLEEGADRRGAGLHGACG